MADKVFINLVNKEVLKEIEIDYRLIDVFTSFIKKLQKYFLVNNYTDLKNYKSFFENYLFDINTSKRFVIEVNNEPKSKSFYDKETNRIVINNSILKDDELEYILGKEFIKFMTIHNLQENRASSSIFNNKFTPNAISEFIVHKLYPNSLPSDQLKLYDFYNAITNNYAEVQSFLSGKLNPDTEYRKFEKYADAYHMSIINNDSNIVDNLTLCVRYLIKSILLSKKNTSISEIISIVEKLHLSPINDRKFIEEILIELASDFVSEFSINGNLNHEYEEKMIQLLLIVLDKNNILDDSINEKINRLKLLFDEDSISDVTMVNKVIGNQDLVSIIKYKFPIINNSNIFFDRDVYVAEYTERIEVLSDITPISKIDKFKEGTYIGKSSGSDKSLVIEDIKEETVGYIYALIGENNLEKICAKDLLVDIKRLLTPVYMNEIIDNYLLEYPDDFNKIKKEELALNFEALKKFKELPYNEKIDLIDTHLSEVEKIIISINNKKISVSLLCNEIENKSIKGELIYLFDRENRGIYNELVPFMNILENKTIIKQNFVLQLNGKDSIDFKNVNSIKPKINHITEVENLLNIKIDINSISEEEVLSNLDVLYYESDLEAERYIIMKEAINKLFKKNKGEVVQDNVQTQQNIAPQGQVLPNQMAQPVQNTGVAEGMQTVPTMAIPTPAINVPGTPIVQNGVQAPLQGVSLQSVPVQQVPVQQAQVQGVPVQPVEQAPVQPVPVQSVPLQQTPVQSVPVQPEPAINNVNVVPVIQQVDPAIPTINQEQVINQVPVAPVAPEQVVQPVQNDIAR